MRFLRRHKCRTALGLLALLLIAAVIFHHPLLMAVGDYLTVSEPPTSVDVIRVMGGHPERYQYAMALYEQGHGSQLVFSFEQRWEPLLQRSRTEIVRSFAESKDIDPENVSTFFTSSTFEEARVTKEYVREQQAESLLVISSPFHMRRVAATFERVMGDQAELHFTSVPFEQSAYHRQWWRDEDSISAVVHEYASLIYYAFNHFW